MKNDFLLLIKWKERIYEILKLRYKDKSLNKKKIFKYLDKIIEDKLVNPKIVILNNYTNVIVKTDVLSIIDLIETRDLIIGGNGVLYFNHTDRDNPLIAYILEKMTLRKKYKKERDSHEKLSDKWFDAELKQINEKILINSLYGALGYNGFVLYNRFNAESVTSVGRNIICSAAEGFEAFLADNIRFSTAEELLHYIYNIRMEYKEKHKNLNVDMFINILPNIKNDVVIRLTTLCKFKITQSILRTISDIVEHLSDIELVLLYYKNNFDKFNENLFIREKIKYIIENVDKDDIWKLNRCDNSMIVRCISDLWDFYKVFVLYDYPIFDRVRKGMYLDKKSVCYVDTDSNFIPLNKFVSFVKDDILNNNFNRDKKETEYIIVSIILNIVENVVDRSMKTMCKYMKIEDDYAQKLNMKNEFFLTRILFTGAKKRYISNALFQEGYILNNGEGLAEIKGFDFKKASVKPFVTDFYTKICLEDILKCEKINIEEIYKKMIYLKSDIENSMKKGESKYFKQTSVQLHEHYKVPYSQSAYTASMLWNILCPEYRLDLPVDIDLIPIKPLGFARPPKDKNIDKPLTHMIKSSSFDLDTVKNKNIRWFAENYPDEYEKLYRNIYNNNNKDIRHMTLNYIAKPKNADIILPEWFDNLIDTEKVVNDTLGLFYPILDSLGLTLLKTSATSQHLSNIIAL